MANASATPVEPKRVLIVEDETLTAMMLESYVQSKGFASAGFCETGEQAVEQAKLTAPDLIIMDFHLSGQLNGIEAARLINADRVVPVFIMSGYRDRIVFEQASGYRPAAFLTKPIDFDAFDRLLASFA
jgi:CheY-like chemotaxis protein